MEKHFSFDTIMSFEKRYRANFVNSLSGFKSINLVGTINAQKQSNLAIFSSVFHLGAHPPLMGMIVRPSTVERHTYENILETKMYTLNHIQEHFVIKAHQTAARYSRETSEFKATGLNEEYKTDFIAPFVKESVIKLGLELKEKINLKINGTILLIGEIKHVYINEEHVAKDGYIDLEKSGSITCSGLDTYHKTQKLMRLSYAKDNTLPKKVE